MSNFSVLRSAKEHILGLSRVGSAGDVEKTDMFLHDSVFEETIIAEYALVINGHSLVRYWDLLHTLANYFVRKINLSSGLLVFILTLMPAGCILLNGCCDAAADSGSSVCDADCAESVMSRELLCHWGPSALLQVFIKNPFPHMGAAPRVRCVMHNKSVEMLHWVVAWCCLRRGLMLCVGNDEI